jgi:monoamine oxidase
MTNKQEKIAIVGAGFAGLSAGYRLKQLGFENIEIYEARERVGGRVLSLKFNNNGKEAIAEMGGWNILDGGAATYINKIADELGLSISSTMFRISDKLYHNGEFYNLSKLLKDFIVKSGGEEGLKNLIRDTATKHLNLDDVMKELFKDDELIYLSSSFRISGFEGGNPHDISSKLWMNLYHILHGGLAGVHQTDEMEIQYIEGGNAKLALGMSDFLEPNVHLGHIVNAIESSDEVIKLSFANGETVFCDKLIFAAPLSVLEDIKIDPQVIPNERLDFLKKIKYGTTGKIISDKSHEVADNFVMTDGISLFQPYGFPYVHMFTAGEAGKNLKTLHQDLYKKAVTALDGETCEDFVIAEAADEQLKEYSCPVTHFWVDDPYAKGSYSFRSVETYDRIYEFITINNMTFREPYSPINNKVFFAGEHTSVEADIGTMEGAVESGYRVAELISFMQYLHA